MTVHTMRRVINEKGAFDIRPAHRSDLDYILSSWMRTWERSPEMNLPGMLRDQFYRHAHLLLDEIIPRCSKQGGLLVCHETGAPNIIRGFACGEVVSWHAQDGAEGEIAYLHWVQTKKQYWRQGVAEALLEALQKDFGMTEDQNWLYTFSARVLKDRELARKACERYNLVAWPWAKYTMMEPGWESGR